jgi:hypothetical protein
MRTKKRIAPSVTIWHDGKLTTSTSANALSECDIKATAVERATTDSIECVFTFKFSQTNVIDAIIRDVKLLIDSEIY